MGKHNMDTTDANGSVTITEAKTWKSTNGYDGAGRSSLLAPSQKTGHGYSPVHISYRHYAVGGLQ
jgi:hypothetical protein